MLRTTNNDISPLLAKKDCEDCTERTLYLRFPHTIKNTEEVEEHLVGNDYTVKLNRQSGRHCFVEFSSLEGKSRNLKALKNKLIDGKRLIVHKINPDLKNISPKKPRKKIRVPKIEPNVQITQTLHVSNIKCGVSAQEIKEALPGCLNVVLLKPYNNDFRSAIVKMENLEMAYEYLKHKKECPEIRGAKLKMRGDTRHRHKKKKKSDPNVLANDVEAQ